MKAYLTSSAGDKMRELSLSAGEGEPVPLIVDLSQPRQTLQGIGGALTQASAAALAGISPEQRSEILEAYFGPEGAAFTLNRTHIASCDFSTESYTYAPTPDPTLADFSIEADRQNGHLALIKDALAVAGADFRLIASAWTAPPWMKDNNLFFEPSAGRGGTLKDEHLQTFSDYIAKYLHAYAAEGVDIWGLTTLNEPHGNNGTWESMEMSPEQQRDFVQHLGATLRGQQLETQILIYDQNRARVLDFARPILSEPSAAQHVLGTAIHWYDSTFRVYATELEALHSTFPDQEIMQTEGCIDNVFQKGKPRGPGAPTPWWDNDDWFWANVATDWGWDWLDNPEVDHPPYAAAFRYARDLVGCMAHWVTAWIDWNIVLTRTGGPNHVGNFCLAPVLVDAETDSVYYTPLFFIMKQVSQYSRPGAVVFPVDTQQTEGLWAAALKNPDGTHVVHLFNETEADITAQITIGTQQHDLVSPKASLMTLVIEQPM